MTQAAFTNRHSGVYIMLICAGMATWVGARGNVAGAYYTFSRFIIIMQLILAQ